MPKNSGSYDYDPVNRSPHSEIRAESVEGHWIRGSAPRLRPNTKESLGEIIQPSAEDADRLSKDEPNAQATQPLQRQRPLKRGHSASFGGLFLFTIVLCFRPYELFPSLSWMTSSALWVAIVTLIIFAFSQLGLEGNLTARPREVNLVLLLCVTAFLSIPGAYNPKESWDAFVDFLKVALIFIVIVNVVRSEGRLKALFWIALVVSCWLSVGALNDYRAGNFAAQGERIVGDIGGMFANPNDMALQLVTIIPIAIALSLGTHGLHMRVLYAACAILMVIGCAVTFSRGGILGLLAVAVVLAWKIGRKQHLAVAVVAILALAAFVLLAPGEIAVRFGSIASDASAIERRDILIRSLIVALRHPLFGIGMNNFHIVSVHELVSHNAYTQVAAELGLTALVCYVMFMVVPYRNLRRIERETCGIRERAHTYYVAIGLQASLVGYMVCSFFASVAYLWYVYYLVGYAVCLRYIYESSAQATSLVSTKGNLSPTSRLSASNDVPTSPGEPEPLTSIGG